MKTRSRKNATKSAAKLGQKRPYEGDENYPGEWVDHEPPVKLSEVEPTVIGAKVTKVQLIEKDLENVVIFSIPRWREIEKTLNWLTIRSQEDRKLLELLTKYKRIYKFRGKITQTDPAAPGIDVGIMTHRADGDLDHANFMTKMNVFKDNGATEMALEAMTELQKKFAEEATSRTQPKMRLLYSMLNTTISCDDCGKFYMNEQALKQHKKVDCFDIKAAENFSYKPPCFRTS